MRNYYMILRFTVMLLFAVMIAPAQAAVWVVDDLGDPAPSLGTLTFRDAVTNANANDTILFNVSGSIDLNNGVIVIDKPMVIMGAQPAHTIIDLLGSPMGLRIATGASGNVVISGMTFKGGTESNFNDAVIVIEAGEDVIMEHVVISGNGVRGIRNNGAQLDLISCSLIGNISTYDGAGIRNEGGGQIEMFNCTLGENNANLTSHGGGIYVLDGSVTLVHCTVNYNSAGGNGGGIQNFGGNVTFQNSVFANNVAGVGMDNLEMGGGGPTYNSNGGNLVLENSGYFSLGTNDIVTGSAFPGMASTTHENGFGDLYYPINSSGSWCIDQTVSFAGLTTDGRRAPRELDANGNGTPEADKGAVEYSPFCVTAESGTGSMDDIVSQLSGTPHGPPYYICFDIAGSSTHQIHPTFAYDFLNETFIDGYSQPGSKIAGPGSPGGLITPAVNTIYFDAQGAVSEGFTFHINASNSLIRGLIVNNYVNTGIRLDADFVKVFGNHVGIDDGGSGGSQSVGVRVGVTTGVADACQIGGVETYQMNVLSGNTIDGLLFANTSGNNHVVYNNFIGPDPSGMAAVTSAGIGIMRFGGTNVNIGKVNGVGAGNLISGNQHGIYYNANNSWGDTISGNWLGLDLTGLAPLPNSWYGIAMFNGCSNVVVGGIGSEAANLISGNTRNGIHIDGGASLNTIFGNVIGLGTDSNTPVANGGAGIRIQGGANGNSIGISGAAKGNLISSNGEDGLVLAGAGTDNNVIIRNWFGVDGTGSFGRGNTGHGVSIFGGARNNKIGVAGFGNVMADHVNASTYGVSIQGAGTNGNTLEGNIIGLLPDGITPMGNRRGVAVSGADSTTIGGGGGNEGNVISSNAETGIYIQDVGVEVKVYGNVIGLDGVSGTNARGNGTNGIYVNTNTSLTSIEIGNGTNGGANTISNSGQDGIFLSGPGHEIKRNQLGVDVSGNGVHPNAGAGISISGSGNEIGGVNAGDFNLIMNSGDDGIAISSLTSQNNMILGNNIGNNGSTVQHLGIDLNSSGVTANDLLDADVGANGGQNYPVLDGAVVNCNGTAGTRITGSLNTEVLKNYRIELFQIPAGTVDPSGFGEGNIYLGSIDVTTGATGNATISYLHGANLPVGDHISATATEIIGASFGGTSEFSGVVVVDNPPQLGSGFIQTDITCNGEGDGVGFWEYNSSHGPLSYLWTNGSTADTVMNLLAGTYTVTVTDQVGCSVTSGNVVIMEPAALSVSPSVVPPGCAGQATGSITITQTGGTAPFQYSIDGGNTYQAASTFTGLAAGTYVTAVMDSRGCIDSIPATLVDPPALTYSAVSASNTNCNGSADGTINITAGGGTGVLSYSIDNGGTYQSGANFTVGAGAYFVVVMDGNGCTLAYAGNPVNITSPAAVNPNVGWADENCGMGDGTITATATGGTAPYDLSIDNGGTFLGGMNATGLNAATYNYVVVDNLGCTASGTVTVGSIAAPTIDSVGITHVLCHAGNTGQLVIHTSGGDGGPFDYSFDNGLSFSGSNTMSSLFAGSYDLVVRNANGICTSTTTVMINEPAVLSVTVAGADATCNGVSNGSATATVSGGNPSYSYLWSPGGYTTNPVTSLGPNNYTVTVTDANGCTANGTAMVNEPAVVAVTYTLYEDSCGAGVGAVIYDPATGGNGGPYQYTIDGGATWQASTAFTGLPAATYSLMARDGNGCTSNGATETINIPLMVAYTTFTPTPPDCDGAATGSINVQVNGVGLPPNPFQINGGAGQSSGLFTGLMAGTYTIMATDDYGCTADSTVTLFDPPALNVSTSTNPTICNGTCTGKGWVTVTGGTPSYMYSFNGGSYSSVDTLFNACGATHAWSVQDGNGCTQSGVFTVNEAAPEDATVSYSPNVLCDGSTTDPLATIVTPAGLFTTSAGPTVDLDPVSGQIYLNNTSYVGSFYVVYTTPCGVIDSAQITINPIDDADFSFPSDTVCVNTPNTTPFAVTPGGVYSGSAGLVINSSTGTIDIPNSGVGTFTVYYQTNGTCSSIDSTTFLIQGAQDATIINPVLQHCGNGPVVTYFAVDGGGTWTGSGINSVTGVFDPSVAGLGVHQIIYEVGAGPCGDSDTINVTVHGLPDVTLSGGGSYCPGGAIPDIGLTVNAGSTPFLVDLNQNGSLFIGNQVITGNFIWSGLPAGSYQVVMVTDNNGCVNSNGSAIIDIVALPAPPTPIASADVTVCTSDPDPTLTVSGGGGPYTWTDANFSAIGNGQSIVVSPTNPGQYWYYVKEQGNNGCFSDYDSVLVTVVQAPPAPTVVNAVLNYCQGEVIQNVPAVANLGGSITWYLDAALTNIYSTGNIMTPPQNLLGLNSFYATETLGLCEGPAVQVDINVFDGSQVEAGADLTICGGDTVQLNATGGVTYQWSNSPFISDTSIADPLIYPPVTMPFYVLVTNAGGCPAIDSVWVTVTPPDECSYTVHNAFSPDGDGVNDSWKIEGLERFADNSVVLVNRWGDEVNSFVGYNNDDIVWMGTNKGGDALPAGTYFYVISANGGQWNSSGWVQIMR